jgi:hypothetical protein
MLIEAGLHVQGHQPTRRKGVRSTRGRGGRRPFGFGLLDLLQFFHPTGGIELGSNFVHNAVDVSHWPATLSKLLLWGCGIEERQCGSPRHAYRSGISHAGPPAHPAQRCQMTSSILPPHTALHVARAPVGAPPQAPRTMPVTRFFVQGMIPDGHMQANSKQHPRTNRSPKIYTSSSCLELKMTFYRKALLLPFFST